MKLNKKHIFLLAASIAVLIAGSYFMLKFFFFPLSVSATRDKIKNAEFNQIMDINPSSVKAKPSEKKGGVKKTNRKVYEPDLTKPLDCTNLNVFLCTIKYLRYLKYLPISLAYDGKYKFSFPIPENLKKIAYSYGWNEQNPFIIGAIAKYLYESGRIKDGDYDRPEINNKLLWELEKSAAKNQFNNQPWDWVLVKQSKTNEKAELYENGRIIFSFPVNTGILGLTPDGTWYVFLRLPDTTMSGLFPTPIAKKLYASLKSKHFKNIECLDGHPVKLVHYSDSGIKYIDYFHKSVALHYMYRKYYGFPQSAGCIELSERDALLLYKQIGYGTIVSVTGYTISKKVSVASKALRSDKTSKKIKARIKHPADKTNKENMNKKIKQKV